MADLTALFRKFEQAMASAAFAEEGEFDTARQLMAAGKNAHKKVLLGTAEPEVDMNMVRYALSLCQRVGARLEILHVLAPGAVADNATKAAGQSQQPFQNTMQKKGVVYQLVFDGSPLLEELVRHVENRRDILCVILGDAKVENQQVSSVRQKIMAEFQKIKCPVVTYGEPVKA